MLHEDPTFGHTWFQTAIDLAVSAEKKTQGKPDRKDMLEARRLYGCAITDARWALNDMKNRDNQDWAKNWANTITDMETKVESWVIIRDSILAPPETNRAT